MKWNHIFLSVLFFSLKKLKQWKVSIKSLLLVCKKTVIIAVLIPSTAINIV